MKEQEINMQASTTDEWPQDEKIVFAFLVMNGVAVLTYSKYVY